MTTKTAGYDNYNVDVVDHYQIHAGQFEETWGDKSFLRTLEEWDDLSEHYTELTSKFEKVKISLQGSIPKELAATQDRIHELYNRLVSPPRKSPNAESTSLLIGSDAFGSEEETSQPLLSRSSSSQSLGTDGRIVLDNVSTKEATLEGWGDLLTKIEWILIDVLGTIRNSMSTGVAFLAANAPVALVVAVAVFAVVGGFLCLHSAIRDTIPGAWKEFQKAITLDNATFGKNIEGLKVALMSLANQVMFATIGATLAAYGIVNLIIQYSSLLSTGAATLAGIALDGIFGATCVLRGGILIGRGVYNLSYLIPFHNQLIGAMQQRGDDDIEDKVEAGLDVLRKELGIESAYIINRYKSEADIKKIKDEVGKESLAEANEYMENPDKFQDIDRDKQRQLEGIIDCFKREKDIESFRRRAGTKALEAMEKYMKDPKSFGIDEKIELLEIVDKGIFTQKLKQYLIIAIGLLMVAGGIALLCASGGVAGIAVLAAIGIAFTLMETNYVVFDWTELFDKIADLFYQRPDYIPVKPSSRFQPQPQ